MWTAFKSENEYWAGLKEFPGLGRKLRILACPANESGCSYYRAILPISKLGELFSNCVETRVNLNPLGVDPKTGKVDSAWAYEDMHWADVILISNIHNFGGPYTARVAGLGIEFGKFVQMDTDDLLTDLYPEHKLYSVYKDNKLDEITKYIYQNVHLVTVTQNKFAHTIKGFIGNILAVVKNSIDYRLPCWNHPVTKSPRQCRISYLAGTHHLVDVPVFAGVPAIVNQKVGRENVIFSFAGLPPPPEGGKAKDWQHDTWTKYISTFMRGYNGPPNYEIRYALPPNAYGLLLTDSNISIAPLALNNFNMAKSEIKVAESGRYAVPLVATNVGCYDETIINGETGYLINPHKDQRLEWADRLSKLAKDKSLREKMGNNLKKITDVYFDINNVVYERLVLYQKVFEELRFKIK